MQVGMAEAGAGDLYEHLTWSRFRHRNLDEPSRLLPGGEPDRFHRTERII
jgi:hypothetical protein